MRIKEELKESGYFWLPSVLEKKVPGILSISDGGSIDLEIVELLDGNMETLFNAGVDSLKRIVGYIEKGGFVTLDNCYYKSQDLTSVGLSKSSFRVDRVFTRVQYDEGEIPRFNTLTFSIEGIDEWVEISGIKVDYQQEKNIPTISYEFPPNFTVKLANGMKLLIIWKTSSKYVFREEAGISEKIYFRLVSQSARELDEFISVVRKITEFLCFAMNKTVSLDSMSATSDDLFKEIEGDKPSPISIDIYYRSWPYAKNDPKIAWYDMLFKFKEIQNDAEKMINDWIKSYEQYDSAFRLYFLAKTGDQMYLEEKFLTLVQGLEAYHQRVVRNMSLRNRIMKIIEPFKDIIGTDENRQKLIDSIMDTRNYLTHHNPSKKPRAATGVNLWPLCMKMELLFDLHILQLTGFSREKIDSIVDNCPELKRKRNW